MKCVCIGILYVGTYLTLSHPRKIMPWMQTSPPYPRESQGRTPLNPVAASLVRSTYPYRVRILRTLTSNRTPNRTDLATET